MSSKEVPRTSSTSPRKRAKTQDPLQPDEDYEEQSDCTKGTLKVQVLRSRKRERVLCLECGKEFADILLSLLIMPVGKILKHLEEGGLVTSDDNGMFKLYSSTKQLDAAVFTVDRNSLIDPAISSDYSNNFLRLRAAAKEKCLNPGCENETQSKGEICDDCEAVTWYACSSLCMQIQDRPSQADVSKLQQCLDHFNNQSYGGDMKCPSCEKSVTRRAFVIQRKAFQMCPEQKKQSSSENGATRGLGFVEKHARFMVKEDLSIIRWSALSVLALVDFADLDAKEIDVGKKEGLLLVRAAMVSKTPLTDVFEPLFR